MSYRAMDVADWNLEPAADYNYETRGYCCQCGNYEPVLDMQDYEYDGMLFCSRKCRDKYVVESADPAELEAYVRERITDFLDFMKENIELYTDHIGGITRDAELTWYREYAYTREEFTDWETSREVA